MIIEKYTTNACCGKTSTFFKLSFPITQDLANTLIKSGFTQQQHFIKAGVFYLTSNTLVLSAPFNTTKLQIKCRVKNCDNEINQLSANLELYGKSI